MLVNITYNKQAELDNIICENLFLILINKHTEIKKDTKNIMINCFKKDSIKELKQKIKMRKKINKLKKNNINKIL